MHAMPVLLILWGAVVVAFIAVMIYRATLTQHETDQLFLNEESSVSNSHLEHDLICERINRLRPVSVGLGGAAVLMTILVVGFYIAQTIPDMHF